MRAITISEVNNYISRILNIDPVLSRICITGEVSSVTYHSSGNVYMTLKDEKSRLACFIPENIVKNLNIKLVEGKTIEATGAICGYERGGTYSFRVFTVTAEKEGELATEFEKLKEKLFKEGLFDSNRKKKIPSYPQKVVIITSDTGAAIEDIKRTAKNLNPAIKLVLIPTLVQGQDAAEDIVSSIEIANKKIKDADVLIVSRGGGNKEDLAAFNEEIVARAIAGSALPVISAIGHEIDFTIADFVSDARAATPTAAAQLAIPDRKVLKQYLSALCIEILETAKRRILYSRNHLNSLNAQLTLLNPMHIIKRGYGAILDSNLNFIEDSDKLKAGDKIVILTKDAKIDANIESINKEAYYD
ncbi:MAG: exodeoxyribonuclease VII large subunit [Eubacteriales bacterium]